MERFPGLFVLDTAREEYPDRVGRWDRAFDRMSGLASFTVGMVGVVASFVLAIAAFLGAHAEQHDHRPGAHHVTHAAALTLAAGAVLRSGLGTRTSRARHGRGRRVAGRPASVIRSQHRSRPLGDATLRCLHTAVIRV
jgi:hypothetical protein